MESNAMLFIMKKARERGNSAGMPEPKEVEKWLIEFSKKEKENLENSLKECLDMLYKLDPPKELQETYANIYMNGMNALE